MRMRRSKAKAACLFGLIYALIFASPAFAGALSDKGEVLITKNCARCHAIGATGESTHKEAPPFRQVVTRYPLENLAEALAEGIVSGHADMPEFVFQPDEIDAILAYLGKLKSETHGAEGGAKSTSP
jgi:mono/diheme cytochrome c family protein